MKQIDFSSQSLIIDTANIYSAEYLIDWKNEIVMNDDQIQVYDHVIQCINRFHQTEDLDAKLIHAKQASELCAHPSIYSLNPISILRSQVDHFIELSYQWP